MENFLLYWLGVFHAYLCVKMCAVKSVEPKVSRQCSRERRGRENLQNLPDTRTSTTSTRFEMSVMPVYFTIEGTFGAYNVCMGILLGYIVSGCGFSLDSS